MDVQEKTSIRAACKPGAWGGVLAGGEVRGRRGEDPQSTPSCFIPETLAGTVLIPKFTAMIFNSIRRYSKGGESCRSSKGKSGNSDSSENLACALDEQLNLYTETEFHSLRASNWEREAHQKCAARRASV